MERLDFVDKMLNVVIGLIILLVIVTVYAAVKENELKSGFDEVCRTSGGIPLRATYHYDPKENKIHYVCLRQTSVMDVE